MANHDIFDGEVLLSGGTPSLLDTQKPLTKDELIAQADDILKYVAPAVTLINPVVGLLLQTAKDGTTEYLVEKKHSAITSAVEGIKTDVTEVKKETKAIKQDIQDIRDRPTVTKQTIKHETTVNIVNAIDFITTKDDSKDDYLERQQNFSRIQTSLTQLSTVAMLNGCNDLTSALNVTNNLVGITQGFETLQMASTLGTLTLATFTGGLGMVSAGFGLCQSIFGKKGGDGGIGQALSGLASMIIAGFQHVIQSIHALQERMDYRFDRIEEIMDRNHFQTITMLFELSRQTNGLYNVIMHGQEVQAKQVHSIRYDIKQISLNLQSCSAMIQANINAFREEKLIDILRKIDYFVSTDAITSDKVNKYLAKLMACFETVAMNPNLTGMTLMSPSSSTDIKTKALQDALVGNLYSVVNVFTGTVKVGHPEILQVLDVYTKQLIGMLQTPTDYHTSLSTKIAAEIDKIKTVTFTNPFSLGEDPEDLVTQNWTDKKKEISAKVAEWFSNQVAIILAKIREVTADGIYNEAYIKLKSPSIAHPNHGPNVLHEKIGGRESIFDSWNAQGLWNVKNFTSTKYYSSNHTIISLEFNGQSLEYIKFIDYVDNMLAIYGIYKKSEFTKRCEQYRYIGIIIKLKICIGFDETIQIYENLIDIISEKQETIIHKTINKKYADLEDLKKYKPIDVLKDAIFGWIIHKTVGELKIPIKCIDDFFVNNCGSCAGLVMYSGQMSIPKIEDFKTKTADFFKLHDDKYKKAIQEKELYSVAEQVLAKLVATQTE